uniref:SGTA homodimerisation domain-containing protein n=1 Tax=Cuerna arida TaxID=1464854 RepID=A0A1B6FH02_9HEMI
MSDTARKLVYAIIQFLKSQLRDGVLSSESAEGVEVGIQCLEAAYNIGTSEPSLDASCILLDVFQKYLAEHQEAQREASVEEKAAAEALKTEGNAHMSGHKFHEAVACYTKAIKLDPKNAVYYCNRAAASNKLTHYESAIQDCKTALKYDPTYSKAYGRLGLAYASLNQHQEAVNYYKKALELEPGNESYKSNLKLAEDSLNSSSAVPPTSVPLPFQNLDLATIFTNPNLLNMASQMLANPSMQSMMSNILSGNLNHEGPAGIDVLLQASQQLAQQMENENPALVEELRRHMGGEQSGSQDGPPGPTNPDSKADS